MNHKIKSIGHIALTAMCIFLALQSCTQPNNTGSSSANDISGELLADTIIYSVVINNLDPTDEWTEECLSQLDRKKMVDMLFESVYSGKVQAFDYITDQEMSISDVKAIENQADFSRDRVGKLQFWESWHYDANNVVMTKNVMSILVAFEITNQEGELLGYKAAFYIKTS